MLHTCSVQESMRELGLSPEIEQRLAYAHSTITGIPLYSGKVRSDSIRSCWSSPV